VADAYVKSVLYATAKITPSRRGKIFFWGKKKTQMGKRKALSEPPFEEYFFCRACAALRAGRGRLFLF